MEFQLYNFGFRLASRKSLQILSYGIMITAKSLHAVSPLHYLLMQASVVITQSKADNAWSLALLKEAGIQTRKL